MHCVYVSNIVLLGHLSAVCLGFHDKTFNSVFHCNFLFMKQDFYLRKVARFFLFTFYCPLFCFTCLSVQLCCSWVTVTFSVAVLMNLQFKWICPMWARVCKYSLSVFLSIMLTSWPNLASVFCVGIVLFVLAYWLISAVVVLDFVSSLLC